MKTADIILIVGIVLIIIISILSQPKGITEEDFNQIKNYTLYVQEGCSHCLRQEKELGDYYERMNVIDCFYTPENCSNITFVPTWLINGTYYGGFKTIEELRGLGNN